MFSTIFVAFCHHAIFSIQKKNIIAYQTTYYLLAIFSMQIKLQPKKYNNECDVFILIVVCINLIQVYTLLYTNLV